MHTNRMPFGTTIRTLLVLAALAALMIAALGTAAAAPAGPQTTTVDFYADGSVYAGAIPAGSQLRVTNVVPTDTKIGITLTVRLYTSVKVDDVFTATVSGNNDAAFRQGGSPWQYYLDLTAPKYDGLISWTSDNKALTSVNFEIISQKIGLATVIVEPIPAPAPKTVATPPVAKAGSSVTSAEIELKANERKIMVADGVLQGKYGFDNLTDNTVVEIGSGAAIVRDGQYINTKASMDGNMVFVYTATIGVKDNGKLFELTEVTPGQKYYVVLKSSVAGKVKFLSTVVTTAPTGAGTVAAPASPKTGLFGNSGKFDLGSWLQQTWRNIQVALRGR